MTVSPIVCDGTSDSPSAYKSPSISPTSLSMLPVGSGRFVHAFRMLTLSLSVLNSSRRSSRFTTCREFDCTRSYVVYRRLQYVHSRRLRMLSTVSLESITFDWL